MIETLIRRLWNYGASMVGWWACALGAARGKPLVGPAVVAGLIAVHLVLIPRPQRWREAGYIGLIGLLGTGVDSLKAATGLISYRGGYPGIDWLCPLWITAMWALFATTANGALSWLKGRYLPAAVLGAIAGPLNYFAGARLGAIGLNLGPTVSFLLLALIWGGVIPLVFWLAEVLERRYGDGEQKSNGSN